MPRTFKARPTTDFAKENLFNVLNHYLDFEAAPTALDLFAGTGSIGIELLSRGCGRVVSIEKDAAHHAFICRVKKEIGDNRWLTLRADVFRFVAKATEQFDFVFADPPYALEQLPELPDLVFRHGLLRPEGLFVLEHGKSHSFREHPHFVEMRTYGSVHFSFFQ